jgi:divalent metal cation (Fe/Co/Zn/Cd) transporter
MVQFVAKDVYGYMIIMALAIMIACVGIYLIYRETHKDPRDRNTTQIILGLCVACAGSFLMVLTILYLLARK